MAPKWRELQAMTDEELEAVYDETAKHTSVGLAWFRDELAHREIRRSTQASLKQTEEVRVLTREIRDLTKSIRTLTVVAIGVTLLAGGGAILVSIATSSS